MNQYLMGNKPIGSPTFCLLVAAILSSFFLCTQPAFSQLCDSPEIAAVLSPNPNAALEADEVNTFISVHHKRAMNMLHQHDLANAARQYKLLIAGVRGYITPERLLNKLQICQMLVRRASAVR